VDYYRRDDGLLALPFVYYPAFLYYNRDLFDQAGLKYPPQKFGEQYAMPDGSQADWNYDTVAQIAKILTLDADGHNPSSPDFDPGNIVQFGFNFQWETMRFILSSLQPDRFYDNSTHRVTFPVSWYKASQWFWNGMWQDHFIPNSAAANSDALGQGNGFSSGHLAMALIPLWYTCCLGDSVGKFQWDIGVVPRSFDGQYHVALEADTFRITKESQHPSEVFTALRYIVDQAVLELAATYDGFPVRTEYQQNWFNSRNQKYNWDINWQVVSDSLPFLNPQSLSHDAFFPNYSKSQSLWDSFLYNRLGAAGGNMNISRELDTLQSDLQKLADAAP
jgi:multiple sugar transport system substrate-binding protein